MEGGGPGRSDDAAEEAGRLDRGDGVALAWRRRPGRGPGVVFLGGFNSDMTGTKAEDLSAFCAERGQAFLRFDYSGHGASGGRFEAGTIGRWAADAAAVLDALATGPQILVGSSMGGWIALLLALRGAEGALRDAQHRAWHVSALVGIAAAPDFTSRMEQALTAEARAALDRDGVWYRPSAYGDPYPIARALIEDGRDHLLLHAPLPIAVPVRLLHGQRDPDVPWELALRIAAQVTGDDVQVLLVKDGDHRLSRPQDLALLRQVLAALSAG
ncbi:alpha/beta hydrolase [Paracraurococcus ruber]|uniref:Palmitoyl-protein thioesterase ABHD10, mitochondrial n=2 Tax=Paracraurococcus ruber TaxID=77675 RepID=A0ABS1CYY6_9PROT|nr:alpha/beta hydrolase [Paracraurococcus ruber]TDG27315.1 alpha/beta hydrolase [Paracraurococcus ruber]